MTKSQRRSLGDKGDEFFEAWPHNNADVLLELFLGGRPKLISPRKRLKTSQRAKKTIDIQNKELGLWRRRDATWKRKRGNLLPREICTELDIWTDQPISHKRGQWKEKAMFKNNNRGDQNLRYKRRER